MVNLLSRIVINVTKTDNLIIYILFQLGAGGSLFIIDHRGNIVLHDNIKPVVSSN